MLSSTSLLSSFERITDYWSPKVIGRVNDQYLKAAKLKGQLAWHAHADEDELFLIARGKLRIEFEERSVELGEEIS